MVIVFLTLAGCSTLFSGGALFGQGEENRVRPWQQTPGGDPERGRERIREYGCDTCHAIPGLPGPESMVGPPLNDWAERHYIAGALPNTPHNLIIWIMEPQSIEPGTAMPDMGVGAQEARDIAAYLYTLD
ncbi:MAG TPA: c-type cytochrome [Anaerolineae bacterium]